MYFNRIKVGDSILPTTFLKFKIFKGAVMQKRNFHKLIIFVQITIAENIFVVFAKVLEISRPEVCDFVI